MLPVGLVNGLRVLVMVDGLRLFVVLNRRRFFGRLNGQYQTVEECCHSRLQIGRGMDTPGLKCFT